MPKVTFKIAPPEKIAEFIFDLKDSLEEGALDDRSGSPCIYVKLPEELRKKLVKSNKLSLDLKEEIINLIHNSKEDYKNMGSLIIKLKKHWNAKINDLFFSEIKKIIGNSLKETYICYITNKVVGAYFGDIEITISYTKDMNVETGSFILAEEILHLVYWQVWKDIYKKDISNIDEIFSIGKGKWSCWHIAEIIPEYLLVENSVFKKFGWRKQKRYLYYTWIPELRKILNPIWKNKKDFRDFITKAHEKLGCSP